MSKSSSAPVLVQSPVIVEFNGPQSGKFSRLAKLFTPYQQEILKAAITSATISASNKGRFVKDADIAKGFELLVSKGVSQKEIAVLFTCSVATVHQVRKWHSVNAVATIARQALAKLNNVEKKPVKGSRLARYNEAKDSITQILKAAQYDLTRPTTSYLPKEVDLFRLTIRKEIKEFATL